MYERIYVTIQQESGQRNFLNALLALATGVLALMWPNFLYYIVGAYLILLSVILFYYRVNNFLVAISALSALLILMLPELIPYTFAFFLTVFGLTFMALMGLMMLGLLMLIFAVLIFTYPGSVAFMIGLFLVLYGLTYLINLLQQSRNPVVN